MGEDEEQGSITTQAELLHALTKVCEGGLGIGRRPAHASACGLLACSAAGQLTRLATLAMRPVLQVLQAAVSASSSSRNAALCAFGAARGPQLALLCLADPAHWGQAARLLLAVSPGAAAAAAAANASGSAAAAALSGAAGDTRDGSAGTVEAAGEAAWPAFVPERLMSLALSSATAPCEASGG